MKLTTLIVCLIPAIGFLSHDSSAQAMSAEKAQKKAGYVAYTSPQQDWPRSDKHVGPIEICRNGIVIYDQLPDRPYEILGTVHAEGDLIERHVGLAAAAAGANAVLVVGDKVFTDAGISVQPRWLRNARVPDPHAPPPDAHRLDHPDQIKSPDTTPTIIVNELTGIVIRWKLR